MKIACIVLTIIIVVAILAICVMVKFATEISLEDRSRGGTGHYRLVSNMGVIALNDHNAARKISERFPYVAAIMRNSSSSWTFACFASIVLSKWAVTSAHCRLLSAKHRALLFHDFIENRTFTYPIQRWRTHEKYNTTEAYSPRYDIAIAKLNIKSGVITKSSTFDDTMASEVEASVWKTVSTMDKRVFLTNDMDKFDLKISPGSRCLESYGVELDESMICVDMSDHEDCFVHEFGPLYQGDKVVGVLAMKPKDCDVKLAIFTNVSYYTSWIVRSSLSS